MQFMIYLLLYFAGCCWRN